MKTYYPEIDLVTTPTGSLVAMVHTNNFSSEINSWMQLFQQITDTFGLDVSTGQIFDKLLTQALNGDADCGGLLLYGYHSGENITDIPEGRPLFVRTPKSTFNLANFMRLHIFSAFAALKIGMNILNQEQVQIDRVVGHGGIFKTPVVAQTVLAATMNAPVTVMENAGEGGAWGIAILAAFLNQSTKMSLTQFLDDYVFANATGITLEASATDISGFNQFVERYQKGLPIEKSAIDYLI